MEAGGRARADACAADVRTPVFVYGTLLAPEVLQALLGRNVSVCVAGGGGGVRGSADSGVLLTLTPATASGLTRYAIEGQVFPAAVASTSAQIDHDATAHIGRASDAAGAAGAGVRGALLTGLDPAQLAVLDAFEDDGCVARACPSSDDRPLSHAHRCARRPPLGPRADVAPPDAQVRARSRGRARGQRCASSGGSRIGACLRVRHASSPARICWRVVAVGLSRALARRLRLHVRGLRGGARGAGRRGCGRVASARPAVRHRKLRYAAIITDRLTARPSRARRRQPLPCTAASDGVRRP